MLQLKYVPYSLDILQLLGAQGWDQQWIACPMVIDIQTFLEITLLLANLGKSIGGVRIILLLKEPSFLILDKFRFWL